jgi:hypothetical protein
MGQLNIADGAIVILIVGNAQPLTFTAFDECGFN